MNERFGLQYRLVEEIDAEYIVSLRTSDRARWLHQTDSDVQKQIQWIRGYKEREKRGEEFYFIYYKDNIPIGLDRIYDIRGNVFSTGSWLFGANAPLGSAFLAKIITRDYAFFDLGLNYEDDPAGVAADNKNVLKFDLKIGMQETGRVMTPEGEFVSVGLSKEDYLVGRSLILKIFKQE